MALLAACAAAAPRNARPAKEDRQEDLTVRVLLVDDQPTASLTSTVDLHIQDGGPARRLPPGTWILTIQDATPPAQRFHLFAKTFPLAERAAAQAYVREWQEKGMTPEIVSFGKRLQAGDKRFLDNRVLWISLIQCKTLSDAEQQRKDLEKQSVWPWIQAETVEPGKGTLVIEDKSAQPALEMSLPAHIHSDTPLVIGGGDYGFWQERREDRTYNGPFQVSVGSHGRLTVIETADIETYLCGVLPAEMPPGWPIEALKAQAVAARSEVLAGMNGRYALEGFDYWATERSRAYLGAGGRHPATDTAVQATAGQVLTDGSRIVPAVFSATCGGWTEDNDTVWSGPPDAQLRAVSDVVVSGDNPAHKPQEQGLANWLLRPPKAHCSGDTTYFRWRKTLSRKNLQLPLTSATASAKSAISVSATAAREVGSSGCASSAAKTPSLFVRNSPSDLHLMAFPVQCL